MGWRGFLRSLNAADRARRRNRARLENAVHRGEGTIDRILSQMDAEIERHVQKVRQLENKILEKPISASGIKYDQSTGMWRLKPLRNDAGKLTWSATIEVRSEPMRCSAAVVDGRCNYSLIAVATTKWALFAAFEITQAGNNGKPTKLFTKSDPSKNKVFLINGTSRIGLQAIEGNFDIGMSPSIGLAAFPLPAGLAQNTVIDFSFDSGRCRIGIHFDNPSTFEAAAASKGLVDMVREQLIAQTDQVRHQARNAKQSIRGNLRGGCSVLFVAAIVFVSVCWLFMTC